MTGGMILMVRGVLGLAYPLLFATNKTHQHRLGIKIIHTTEFRGRYLRPNIDLHTLFMDGGLDEDDTIRVCPDTKLDLC